MEHEKRRQEVLPPLLLAIIARTRGKPACTLCPHAERDSGGLPRSSFRGPEVGRVRYAASKRMMRMMVSVPRVTKTRTRLVSRSAVGVRTMILPDR